MDLFAVGARSEITDAQIGLLDEADEALRVYPRLPKKTDAPLIVGHNHAEGKLLTEAINLQVTPKLLIASNDFCDEFRASLIERLGGKIVSPRMARWQ
ncbi:hypothetical protein [Streptomyces sp. NPDC005435]|uniref:hypothetical protein n=1 Tax=Streptomyces sp. NPDC005435 TaxID=3154464 RepID=UPI0034539FEA